MVKKERSEPEKRGEKERPVSYTHLTLPTNSLVYSSVACESTKNNAAVLVRLRSVIGLYSTPSRI